jgi:hypothetical protein
MRTPWAIESTFDHVQELVSSRVVISSGPTRRMSPPRNRNVRG